MADCIFCLIVQGKIPARKVYEDKETIAFLDINPRVKGHAVVIPKKHAETLLELDEHATASLFSSVKKTAALLKQSLHATGFNTGNNNDKSAGQAVGHVHIHILPRYADDKFHHAGFEAAFPIDEDAKKHLDDILKQVQSGAQHDSHGDDHGHDDHGHEEHHDDHKESQDHEKHHDVPHHSDHEKMPNSPKEKAKKGVFINDDYPDFDE